MASHFQLLSSRLTEVGNAASDSLQGAVTEMNEQEATKALRDSDAQRRDYFKRFYKITEERPDHYDVVVNTDVLTPGQAIDIIVAAARS